MGMGLDPEDEQKLEGLWGVLVGSSCTLSLVSCFTLLVWDTAGPAASPLAECKNNLAAASLLPLWKMTPGTYLTKKKWRMEFLEMQFNEAKVTFCKGTVTPKWNAVKKLFLRSHVRKPGDRIIWFSRKSEALKCWGDWGCHCGGEPQYWEDGHWAERLTSFVCKGQRLGILRATGISTMRQGFMGNQNKTQSIPSLLSLFLQRGETKWKKDNNPRDSKA